MLLRTAGLAAAFCAAGLTGVAAGTVLVPPPAPAPDAPALASKARPGSDRVDAQIPDPAGGPRWAVRRSTGLTGQPCIEAGRFDGRRYGRTDGSGEVEHQPADEQGSCFRPSGEPVALVVNRYADAPGAAARTVVFGQAEDAISRIVVTRADEEHEAAFGPRRTFVVVLPGLVEVDDLAIDLIAADGSSRRFGWR